jgi:spermidine dehydrogenase
MLEGAAEAGPVPAALDKEAGMIEERHPDERALGMDRQIARRDFLGGVAASATALIPTGSAEAAHPQDESNYYPPALGGMRGSHPGSFEAAHQLRDGALTLQPVAPGSEHYDLVIVGAGISGLSAAHFYREARPTARILILDNHDDFGGHAKRNEFVLGGRMHLLNGGTLEIDSPRPYSAVAAGLMRRLGIMPARLEEACARREFYQSLGLRPAIFLDRETFGADTLIVKRDGTTWAQRLAGTPLTPWVQADIARIYEDEVDYLAGLSSDEKKARLARISYRDFLVDVVKADPAVIPFFQAMTHGEWGVGIDAVGALEVWPFKFPGFQGLGLKPGSAPHMGFTAAGYAEGGSDTFHFPDGNASIARLLVRNLIPEALPGHTVEDVVTAHADYAQLDRPGATMRIRLSSIVLRLKNLGPTSAPDGVAVTYTRGGELTTVRGAVCVLACWNTMIPYLCPDLPVRQREALHSLVKTPLVYTSVALTNWCAFINLGISDVYAPGSYHTSFRLNPTVDIGHYQSPRSPDAPILIHMTRTPCQPGSDQRTQNRAGRVDLLATGFQTFERNIREQLGRTLGPGGFNPAEDITAITVNRWPHGYAYEYNPLFDPDWDEHDQPHVVGRQPFGRITIANSDAGASAYTDSAIDQAHRAVSEMLAIED